jgi:hypothetical protein
MSETKEQIERLLREADRDPAPATKESRAGVRIDECGSSFSPSPTSGAHTRGIAHEEQ